MSQENSDRNHGRSCECPSCRNVDLNSIGASFTDQQRQQLYGDGPVNARPVQRQVPQWQIDQGKAELQALANNSQLREEWTSFNPDPTFRSLFLQDRAPAHHPYATELEFDIPSSPPSNQAKGNAQRPSIRCPSTQSFGNARMYYDAFTASQSDAGLQVQGTPAASSMSNQLHNTHQRRDAMRNRTFQATDARRINRQSAAGRLHPVKQQADRVLTPSSSEESDA